LKMLGPRRAGLKMLGPACSAYAAGEGLWGYGFWAHGFGCEARVEALALRACAAGLWLRGGWLRVLGRGAGYRVGAVAAVTGSEAPGEEAARMEMHLLYRSWMAGLWLRGYGCLPWHSRVWGMHRPWRARVCALTRGAWKWVAVSGVCGNEFLCCGAEVCGC